MKRRAFMQHLGSVSIAGAVGPVRPRRQPGRRLIMDAMGELREEYTPALVREMLASGLSAITVTLSDPKPEGSEALAQAIDGLIGFDRHLARNPELFLKATSVLQVDQARAAGKMAVFYLYQNTVQFGADLDRVDFFHRQGLRTCQLTYNDANLAGAGCRATGRLTDFGRQLIDRMNQAGMLVDLSHANMETMADAILASRVPVVISHTGAMTVHRHVRNTTDANLKSLADRGGVVGICQIRPFITDKKSDNLDAYLDHLDHAVKVAGIEHVAIGSDRDHRVITITPEYVEQLRREEGSQLVEAELPLYLEALNGPRRMEVLERALGTRRYRSGDIDRIMGDNLYRLYRSVIG